MAKPKDAKLFVYSTITSDFEEFSFQIFGIRVMID
jgi:hypothetical protein